jgi:hypothetical protein
MGMWAFNPWDNDQAADWYGVLMETTKFREAWLRGIHASPVDAPDVVRAAAALFVMLGRVYVWPIETFNEDLEHSISALERVAECEDYSEFPELLHAIAMEIAELKTRRKKSSQAELEQSSAEQKPWWTIWES